jgi:rieske iron-sulfur protein
LWQERRAVLKGALGLGIGLAVPGLAGPLAADDGKEARPRKGDRLVFAYGDRAGQVIVPADLVPDGPQQLAFPMDPVTKVVRDGSLLNQVALLRLDPARLSEETRAQAAGGIVAYSAVCTHQGCPISMWHALSKTLFCACHASRFDPADGARVVDGPAPRRLPMLPLEAVDGGVVAAGEFSGRVGGQTH